MKLSAPTASTDDGTDDCASGADDVAVPAKVQISTFSNDRCPGGITRDQLPGNPDLAGRYEHFNEMPTNSRMIGIAERVFQDLSWPYTG